MYLAVDPHKSAASAWLAAVQAVDANPGHVAHNVIVDVESPLAWSAMDNQIADLLDDFLRQHGAYPLASVANTIFPDALYQRHGAPRFRNVSITLRHGWLETKLPLPPSRIG
jgi:hypothetical protein